MDTNIRTALTLLVAIVALMVSTPGHALECGFFTRDNCDEVCAGKRVIGCRTCGFWCEECECGEVVPVEKVCCHVKGADCNTKVVPDAAAWMTAEECERTWGGIGEKTCPPETCGPPR